MLRSRNQFLLATLIATLGSALPSQSASAQSTYPQALTRQSAPYQPKLSPYLDLLRDDNSLLSPYHSFVLPRRELNQRQAWQAVEIRRLEQAAGRRDMSTTLSTSRLTTGRGARFQTTLHFYPSMNNPN